MCKTKIDPLCTSIHRMRDTYDCFITSLSSFSKNVFKWTNVIIILHFLDILLFLQYIYKYTLFLFFASIYMQMEVFQKTTLTLYFIRTFLQY